jgi:MFS family permease
MLATKYRPVQSFREVIKDLFSNGNYLLVFFYFQLVNTVTVYGGEIATFTANYDFTINQKTIASMLYCITAIIGSLIAGKLLDKYKTFKMLQN